MRQVILDTSFILSAVAKKIDFFDKIGDLGLQPVVPEQALRELKGLGAHLALEVLGKRKFSIVSFPGKDADAAIIAFAKKNPEAIIATLDAGLKRKTKNRKLVIRGQKKLEIM